ncbi:MAG: hypothetical protein B6D76_06045 [gamma proteobacterium symbiont of Stewartia floridana]|nr:MAG: hypothetical protein B6D76_06045 [gamma proteobacterium symbiont of Stewartia floridana]RLW61489.1 MAG: hypothetical protein B6D75_02320 [gamma proteobacterium symbiont of Stewartia floridana]
MAAARFGQTGEMATQEDFNLTRPGVTDLAVTIRYLIRFTADGRQLPRNYPVEVVIWILFAPICGD